MPKPFKEIMDYVELDDLMKLKKDIETGGFHLKKLVDEKIKQQTHKHEVLCSVCMNTLDAYSTNNYTLVFGPDDFKKKATFCGVDCLEYFLKNLKKIKEDNRNEH